MSAEQAASRRKKWPRSETGPSGRALAPKSERLNQPGKVRHPGKPRRYVRPAPARPAPGRAVQGHRRPRAPTRPGMSLVVLLLVAPSVDLGWLGGDLTPHWSRLRGTDEAAWLWLVVRVVGLEPQADRSFERRFCWSPLLHDLRWRSPGCRLHVAV